MLKNSDLLLYLVTDRHWLGDRSLKEDVEKALQGGGTFVQLREKHLEKDVFLQEAREIQSLCKKYQVPFVINDNVELASEISADGVHVGQSDTAAKKAREMLGNRAIIGVSVSTLEQAKRAEQDGADYLGVGAVFPTSSKDDAELVSHEMLQEITKGVSIPVIAIGGIDQCNVEKLKNTGIQGIAVISAIFSKEDIRGAAEELRDAVQKVVE